MKTYEATWLTFLTFMVFGFAFGFLISQAFPSLDNSLATKQRACWGKDGEYYAQSHSPDICQIKERTYEWKNGKFIREEILW